MWLLLSGRGFGKTWVGSNWIIEGAKREPDHPMALVGQTKADVRDTMIEMGESGILAQSRPDFMPHYEPSKRRLTWPNGAVAMIYSGDEPDQLRGPQHGRAWVDELAKFKYPQQTWDNLELGLRLGPHPRACVTTTPRPLPIIKALAEDPVVHVVVGSTFENEANLPDRFLQRVRKQYEGTRLGRQELYGAILSDVPGALWTYALIERHRVNVAPGLPRVGIAIDPAVTGHEDSNQTGIIAGGIAEDGHGYVLRDASGRYSPDGWGRRAVDLYHELEADFIVAEVNNGGDLVEHVIRTIDKSVAYRDVRASRGKYTRAEPVAALYEQGRIHHVGGLPDLEDQQCTWVPGEDSPDRVDALVWLFTELMVGPDTDVRRGKAPKKLQGYRG